MNILIGGDLVPTDINMKLFCEGKINQIIDSKLSDLLKKADIRIFNLEVPLTNELSPIKKWGPNLNAPTETIKGIKMLNPSLITLANNHIMDHGDKGLQSTINILNNNKIPFLGVGDNIFSASKPYILKKKEKVIGIYACAENEFSIATEERSGANPFDPLESLDHINKLKNQCDYVIVLYHGGKEHYRYPSPYLQKVCRKIAEKGADLIICQHSHCIGSFEEYKDSTIIYGQGNFIFNKHDNEFWNNALIINLELDEDINIEYIPICKDKYGIRLANKVEKEYILSDFFERSDNIKKQNFLKKEYLSLAKKNEKVYLEQLAGFNRISRKLNSISKGRILNLIYNKNNKLALKNYIQCEAHRELILSLIEDEGK